MPNWGMNADMLYGAGGNVSKLSVPGAQATKGMLESAGGAADVVHHPIMRGALNGFVETWATPANRLVHNIEAAGSQVQDAAVTGDQADLDADTEQQPVKSLVSEHLSALSKPINDIV
ncbi:hypothetical protein [Solicola gregarius]|uniref:Uncharacterized protein n=1 Tax=Solicola gregarius TaxID=2908642 RepID=A0AA46THI9_9ACTN|nr:hypothetical protein [Solicola gregarius]UYM04937.1 hypothetical protein L0C25_20815 [Solicola gregarius]